MEQNRSRPSGRVLALDPGRLRTGVALSDPEGLTAAPLETIQGDPDRVVERVLVLIAEHEVTTVVIGLPRLPSGDEGEIAEISRRLAARIEQAAGTPILLRDETLTSWAAEEHLRAMGRPVGRPDRRGGSGRTDHLPSRGGSSRRQSSRRRGRAQPGEVDRVAAAFLLQDYLDERGRNSGGQAPTPSRACGDADGPAGPESYRPGGGVRSIEGEADEPTRS